MAAQPEARGAGARPKPDGSALAPLPSQDVRTAVRRAEPVDLPALTRMLVRAYMDDPVAIWICGHDGLRARTLAAMYSLRLRQTLPLDGIWTTPEHSSAAVWLPPSCEKPALRPDAALLRCLLDPRMLVRAPLLAAGLRSIDSLHPKEPPHWYLSLLGTDPAAQGAGLGSAMLRPVLERADEDGVGAYLESSKPRNLGFYARFGFQVTGELQIPHGGPKMWPMWREPQPS